MNAVSASVRRGSGPTDEPDDERRGRDDQDERDEDLGDAVGEALDRRLRALGPLDELDDPGEGRVAPDPRRAHDERAGRVEGRADDLVARVRRDRDRLAGQHRRVDRGRRPRRRRRRPGPGRRAGPAGGRPTATASSGTSRRRSPSTHDERGRRAKADEPADRAGRPALGAGLEPATEQDEPDDDRRAVEVGLRARGRPTRRRPARA